MPIRYKEYTIFHDELGVTMHRTIPKGYGPTIKYRNSFTSLEKALMYIAERETVINNGTLEQAIHNLKQLRRDLMSIGHKLLDELPKEEPKKPVTLVKKRIIRP